MAYKFNPFTGNFDYYETGSGSAPTVVANFSALPAANTVSGQFYWCSASQGTSWLPGWVGGTYYNRGLYYSNGTTWEFMDTPYQATQVEVNTGTNTDKFVTPDTLKNSTQFQYLDATSSIQTQFSNITGGNVSFKRISGYWYSSAVTNFVASTAALSRDIIRLTPFIVSENESFDRISMEISSAGTAGSLVRLGIYNSSGGYPTTNLLNAGTILGDSQTNQTITISQALTPGVYWLAYTHNSVANISFRTIQATTGAIPSILGIKDGDYTGNQYNLITMNYTYDGTFPTISGATLSGLNVAIVGLRKA